ncbi:MAG: carbohydrate binding domain-containing protein, partial [bacterium]
MRKIIIVLGVAIMLLLPHMSKAKETIKNLAPNPSLEQGEGNKVIGWAFWGWAPEGVKRTAKGIWDKEVARTGKCSLKVINESETDVGTWDNGHGGAFIPVEAGKSYTVSIYMKVDSLEYPLRTNFRIGFCKVEPLKYIKSETTRIGVGQIKQAGTWQKLTVIGKAPEGANRLRTDFDLIGKGTAWFDDVEV